MQDSSSPADSPIYKFFDISYLLSCCINALYSLTLGHTKPYKTIHPPFFSFVLQNIQIFLPSTCTITIPIHDESAMKLLWKTNALSPLIWIVQKPFTHQYSSSRYAKGGCLLGGCSAGSQNLHAPHPEARFFLWGILVHLHQKAKKFLSYWFL